jgi:hypothetical protein
MEVTPQLREFAIAGCVGVWLTLLVARYFLNRRNWFPTHPVGTAILIIIAILGGCVFVLAAFAE